SLNSCAFASHLRCCNTCKEVQQAYYEKNWVVTNMTMFKQCQREDWETQVSKLGKEGCRIHGQLQVNKVAGSFHISPGNSYAVNHVHVHHLQNIGTTKLNMSHKITKLSFGKTFPGQVNPLDDTTMNVIEPAQMFTYYMKLVPTIYSKFDQKVSSEIFRESCHHISAVKRVRLSDRARSFLDSLVS
ncbi:Endoplasmic reticulum-Golgi intermediate compartment protein 3, partial [Fasciola gigantica]